MKRTDARIKVRVEPQENKLLYVNPEKIISIICVDDHEEGGRYYDVQVEGGIPLSVVPEDLIWIHNESVLNSVIETNEHRIRMNEIAKRKQLEEYDQKILGNNERS